MRAYRWLCQLWGSTCLAMTFFHNFMEDFTSQNAPNLTPYVPLVAESAARSLACVTCYPIGLARTCMQAFRETQTGGKPPGVWKTLHGPITPVKSTNDPQTHEDIVLWTGVGAQLARDVPFSAIRWSPLEPVGYEEEFVGLGVMKPVQPLSLGQVSLPVFSQEALQLLPRVHLMSQEHNSR